MMAAVAPAFDEVSEAVAREVLALRAEGWTWRESALHVNRPLNKVRKAAGDLEYRIRAKEADLKRAADIASGKRVPLNKTASPRKGGMKLQEIQDAIRLRKAGVPWAAAGEELGYNWKTVKQSVVRLAGEDPITEEGAAALRKLQNKTGNLRKGGAVDDKKRHGKRMSREDERNTLTLRKAGLSTGEIAQRIGFTATTVLNCFERHGGDPQEGRSRKEVKLGFSFAEAKALRVEGKSWRQIAVALGVAKLAPKMGGICQKHFKGDPWKTGVADGSIDPSGIAPKNRPRASPKKRKKKRVAEVAPPVTAAPAPAPKVAAVGLEGYAQIVVFGQVLFDGPLSARDATHIFGLIKDL